MIATRQLPDLAELAKLNAEFETAPAQEIMRWAVETYAPRVAITSSFGASAGAILHMLAQIDKTVPVVFLQTHYHFSETLRLRDQIADLYGLTVENWEVWGGRPAFLGRFGDDLNKRPNLEAVDIPEEARRSALKTGVDLCCWLNKVEPMKRALRNRDAYITSLRRDGGSEHRARTRILDAQARPGDGTPMVKVNPMANWDRKKLWKYIHEHKVPVHELWPLGYKSIGCAPCTKAVGDAEDERSGRWTGLGKTECGIHTSSTSLNYSI